MNLFKKPQPDNKEELQETSALLFKKAKEYEELEEKHTARVKEFDDDFNSKKSSKLKELADLDNTLELKRAERTNLELPLNEREERLIQKENELNAKDDDIKMREQNVLVREHNAGKLEDSLGEMSIVLHEKSFWVNKSHKEMITRENSLVARENAHLLSVERHNGHVTEKNAQLDERERDIQRKESNVKDVEKAVLDREAASVNALKLIQSRRDALTAAIKEWQAKTEGQIQIVEPQS